MHMFGGLALVLAGIISYMVLALQFGFYQQYPLIHFVLCFVGLFFMLRQTIRSYKIWRLIVSLAGGFLTGAFLWWTLVFSAYSQEHQVNVGQNVADRFAEKSFRNAGDEPVTLASLLDGQAATLLVFYRGFW